jgi:hypothetical protein
VELFYHSSSPPNSPFNSLQNLSEESATILKPRLKKTPVMEVGARTWLDMQSSGGLEFRRQYEVVEKIVRCFDRCRVSMLLASCSLLPCKALIEEGQYFGNVKLDVLQIKVLLAIFLHLKQVVELEIEFEQSSSAA